MEITGKNLIGFEASNLGSFEFHAIDPSNGKKLPHSFIEATAEEVQKAIYKAEEAFIQYRKKSGHEKALFLETIAEEILNIGDVLIERCSLETGLPKGRLEGERGRTVFQLRLFAALLKEGSWVDARIDHAIPDRQPVPKPDIRQMQMALGPVGIFGASNFPLAFSVAGGDTASALAAGCTIVVKGHPAHPGTSELVGKTILEAAHKCGMPDGVFSLLQGPSVNVGLNIVRHPLIKAIGFTGSYKGGKALFDEANKRKEPIPVYAEMGSSNPLFILPRALEQRKEQIAQGLTASVTLGTGQFCTNPGLTIVQQSPDSKSFEQLLADQFAQSGSSLMLSQGIKENYYFGLEQLASQLGVEFLAQGKMAGDGAQGIPKVLKTSAKSLIENPLLEKEVFGPSTLLVEASGPEELLKLVHDLEGHLTATLHATEEDLLEYEVVVRALERKVGRLIINGFPTGVEVCHAMVHGGPFPATSDSRMTSVGTGAITRFTRPFCYQNFPEFLLPEELVENNPLGIWRIVDGERTK